VCPYCRSTRIAAPIGTTGAATYWRCDGCGEMWNQSRQTKRAQRSRWDRY
jgi:transposase-like protein